MPDLFGTEEEAWRLKRRAIPRTIFQHEKNTLRDLVKKGKFDAWYEMYSDMTGLNPNPDDPRHKYDYRAWFKAMRRDYDKWKPGIDPGDLMLHGPSAFKADDHPNRFIMLDGRLYDSKHERYVK